MPTIGQDCHIILTHPQVNNGQPYGFLVTPDGGIRPGGVSITHEVDSFGRTRLYIYFDILLADRAINPNGSPRAGITRQSDYALIMAYLSKMDSINLTTPIGSFLNLGAVGWTADERHMPDHSVMKCQINNVGVYWPPVPPDLLAQCVWGQVIDENHNQAVVSLNWGNSYWR